MLARQRARAPARSERVVEPAREAQCLAQEGDGGRVPGPQARVPDASSGQITLRRIASWRTIAAVLGQHPTVAA
jgi:hypothetical protein